MASGTGIAIEDAIVLSELLQSDESLPRVLEQFMARRYERCRMVVDASLQISEWDKNPNAGIPKETVKTRFHRANRLLREVLSARLESILDVFPFAEPRCGAVQKTVLARLSFLNRREP